MTIIGNEASTAADVGPVEDPAVWDVVIVGTGMGGSTLSYSLACQGLKVLLLEKGGLPASPEKPGDEPDAADARLRLGLWPDRVRFSLDEEVNEQFATLGCGVGGSTQLFSAALERFEPHDFETSAGLPHPTGGWPLSYSEFAPYYAAAETLFRVSGTQDPLGKCDDNVALPSAEPSEADKQLMQDFAGAGLHPYRLHVGIAYKPGCKECLGYACAMKCKSDANSICIEPALATGNVELRTGCEVVRIEADGACATGVIYRYAGKLHRARGQVIALAAGTYRTAALLLASASTSHPNGLANRSGLVARNLMLHSSDLVAVWPSRRAAIAGPRKTLATRAFYRHGSVRLGALQSIGLSAGYGNILVFLYRWFDSSWLRQLRFLRPLLRIPAHLAARLFGDATLFALIIEDMPYLDNRVVFDPEDPSKIVVHYQVRPELKERGRLARQLVNQRLRNLRKFWLFGHAHLNNGHPCGTCRMGHDPAQSVLDPSCRTHDVDNLYVVDASFMPTSGGANPSLTIAANALRVGELLAKRFKPGGSPIRQAEACGELSE